ncbi:VRR-NUC domain-containing protein [Hutsoniella sourekii]|uniref:VRR-NUC domain-containing protein n=1 Tax=Hutsoniella sourekii TaxID=87650 RepID=UPI0004862BBC|nr:VRR-NUC domain-containing protein [Hutsoniella sourekii]
MLPEKKVENAIKRYLDSLGAYWIKTLGGSVPAGTPDIIACVNGRFVAIEVKRPEGGTVSELQKHKIKMVNNAGGVAFVATSVEEVREELSRFNII